MYASPKVSLGHFPTHNSTLTVPCEMFSQYPSNDRWCSWLAALPDGHLLYTTASIVIGPLHSFPLNLKYHRLHPPEVSDLRFPWNETLSAVFDVSFLKVQSCDRIIVKKTTILKKALVSHLSRMFMDVIYRVKSCKNKQTNKEKNKKQKQKPENIRTTRTSFYWLPDIIWHWAGPWV